MTHTSSKKEELPNKVREILTGDMAVTRVWEAWQVGTMTQDDFVPLEETERVDEIVTLIKSEITQALKELKEEAIETIQCYKVETEHGRTDQHYEYGVNRGLAIAIAILEGVEEEVIEDKQREFSDNKIKELEGL